ncbi:hypothetical protein M0P48_04095 [Candidatus Gracilibacteria bacterium]|jgi:hypothetical protein|nr:hypothetical protein [Candidatus Gracilibacteria bacterium]
MKIIEIFNSIRDIPFKIPLSIEDQSVDCDKKHKKLYDALKKEKIDVRFRVCTFLWSEQSIPKKILEIPHVDKCEHLYLEAFINKKWVTLDITWDILLNKIFAIKEWDGISDTDIAVKPLEILSQEENQNLSHNVNNVENFLEDIKNNRAFYKALNLWLEANRS